jgi:hypothetical protein
MGTSMLLTRAYSLHYGKRFPEACAVYREILSSSPSTEEEAIAHQQLGNLREFDAGRSSRSGPPHVAAPQMDANRPSKDTQQQNRGDLQGGEGRVRG